MFDKVLNTPLNYATKEVKQQSDNVTYLHNRKQIKKKKKYCKIKKVKK